MGEIRGWDAEIRGLNEIFRRRRPAGLYRFGYYWQPRNWYSGIPRPKTRSRRRPTRQQPARHRRDRRFKCRAPERSRLQAPSTVPSQAQAICDTGNRRRTRLSATFATMTMLELSFAFTFF